MTEHSTSRRAVLGGIGALGATAVAGCLGAASESDAATTASFFVVGAFAERVAADVTDVDTLVPVGQHGHGWEPSATIQRDVLQSDAFVYVGEGFQPWADDVVENVEQDSPETATVAAWDDVDLLAAGASHTDHSDHEADDGHGQGTHEGDHHEEGHGSETHHEPTHDESGHDHSDADPHFWLDPVRAQTAVETIADGLAAADQDNAETYRENAAAYTEELAALDSEFEAALADRTKDVVLVAGHNAYQYLGARYGFEVHALTGLAPDDTPSPQDVREAQSVVDEHAIDVVLTPAFESDRAARQLVAETDAAAFVQITAIPGYSEAWADRDWGYVDIMRELNLPALRRALGAE